jgi:peptidoglycan hydrolase FlgJ
MSEVRATGGLPPAGTVPGRAVEEAARDFEAVFLAQYLRSMFEGVDGGLSGPGADAYKDMLTDEYAKLISRAGGIGVGDAVLREMLKLQEVG